MYYSVNNKESSSKLNNIISDSTTTENTQGKGKLWVCDVCNSTFTTKGSLKRHVTTIHASGSADVGLNINNNDNKKNGEATVDSISSAIRVGADSSTKLPLISGVPLEECTCSICKVTFKRRDELYAHLRRCHQADDQVETLKKAVQARRKSLIDNARKNNIRMISHENHNDFLLPSGGVICPHPNTTFNKLSASKMNHVPKCISTSSSAMKMPCDQDNSECSSVSEG